MLELKSVLSNPASINATSLKRIGSLPFYTSGKYYQKMKMKANESVVPDNSGNA
jgi:hypothetical protein